MKKSQCGNAGDVMRDRDIHWKLIGSCDSITSRTFVSNVGEWMWQISIKPNEFTHRLWRNSAVSLEVPSDWRFFSNVTTRGKREIKTFKYIIQINSSDPNFKWKSLKSQFKTNHWNRLFKQAYSTQYYLNWTLTVGVNLENIGWGLVKHILQFRGADLCGCERTKKTTKT